jgi:hypothetical protein
MLGHVAHWINTGAVVTRVNDTLTEDPVFTQLMLFLDNMIVRSSSDASHFLYGQEFNIQVEKIELIRAASNYEEALQLIDNLYPTVTEPIQYFILDKLQCLSRAEKALFTGEVSPDNLFKVYGTCLDAYFDDPNFGNGSTDRILNSLQSGSINKNEGIQIWPNPAQNELTINILTEFAKAGFNIYNLVGNELLTGTLQPGLQQINLSDLSNGIYIIKINADDKVRSFKFVVMK